MLTDPVKFYEYFQIAHSQLIGQKKNKEKQGSSSSGGQKK